MNGGSILDLQNRIRDLEAQLHEREMDHGRYARSLQERIHLLEKHLKVHGTSMEQARLKKENEELHKMNEQQMKTVGDALRKEAEANHPLRKCFQMAPAIEELSRLQKAYNVLKEDNEQNAALLQSSRERCDRYSIENCQLTAKVEKLSNSYKANAQYAEGQATEITQLRQEVQKLNKTLAEVRKRLYASRLAVSARDFDIKNCNASLAATIREKDEILLNTVARERKLEERIADLAKADLINTDTIRRMDHDHRSGAAMARMTDKVKDQETSIKVLEERIKDEIRAFHTVADRNHKLSEQIELMERGNSDLANRFARLKKDVNDMGHTVLIGQFGDYEGLQRGPNKRAEELLKKIKELMGTEVGSMHHLETENAMLRGANTEFAERHAEYEKRILILTNKLGMAEKRIACRGRTNTRLQVRNVELLKKIKALETEMNNLEVSYHSRLSTAIEMRDDKIKNLESFVETAKKNLELAASSPRRVLEDRIKELEAQNLRGYNVALEQLRDRDQVVSQRDVRIKELKKALT